MTQGMKRGETCFLAKPMSKQQIAVTIKNMNDFILNHALTIRLSAFLGMFGVMALWEIKAPRRRLIISKAQRWISKLGLVALNNAGLGLLFPAAAVGMACFTTEQAWGLFNLLTLPVWLEIVSATVK